MKKLFLCLQSLLFAAGIAAQSNVSAPMSFHIEKEVVPPILSIVPNTLRLVDPSNNNVIDGGEVCKICFEVENTGRGDAFGCTVLVNATGSNDGLIIRNVALPVIHSGDKTLVEVPIEASERTQTGQVALTIKVNEPNGFGTNPIHYTIGTHKLRTPLVQVADSRILGEKGGKLMPREMFKLQVIIQNADQGLAENVMVGLQLPSNVHWVGGTTEHISIGSMRPNETRVLEYELVANELAGDKLNLKIALKENTGKYARDAEIPLQFGQYIGSSIAMNVERNDEEVTITKATLISDVDKDIPVTNNTKNKNTFVLIIANEHYQQVAAVPFALNDGNIFREYCIKTLGIGEKRIKYLADATGNQIKAGVNWLDNITETFDDPNVIVYYAGHGIPDETNKSAYLLPVDGSGTDVSTGYKLDDLYATLGKMPASRIAVFMDACFSGSKREEGMLASARGVALKAKSGVPQGNMVVFSAALGDETAYPNREQQHGLFTYYLLKKLQETEGNVELKALGDYVTKQVSQQSLLINSKKQTPSVTPSASLGNAWQTWKLK